MPTKTITELFKPDSIKADEWDLIRCQSSHAELVKLGCVRTYTVECCPGDGTGCADHDPDAILLRDLRDKALAGSITSKEVADHNLAEIRLKAKGLL